jgi:hypothetical protein
MRCVTRDAAERDEAAAAWGAGKADFDVEGGEEICGSAEALGEALGGAGRGEMQGAEEVERGPGPGGVVLEKGAEGGGEVEQGAERFEGGRGFGRRSDGVREGQDAPAAAEGAVAGREVGFREEGREEPVAEA